MNDQEQKPPSKEDYKQPMPTVDDFIIRTMQEDLSGQKEQATNVSIFSNNDSLAKKNPTKNVEKLQEESPFGPSLVKIQEKSTPAINTFTKKNKPELVEISTKHMKNVPSGNILYKSIFSVIILFILGISGAGFYYYTNLKKTPTEEKNITQEPQKTKSQQQDIIIETPSEETLVEKYSTSKPNFLPINTTASSINISDEILKIGEEIKMLSSVEPYEFLIVDLNNNPIAFLDFAKISGLTMPTNITDSFDKDFSLYIYNDKGNIRTGLSVKIKNNHKKTLTEELLKQEKKLTKALSFLFLNTNTDNLDGIFLTSEYDTNKETIRYLNVNKDKTLSIDYSVTEQFFIVGTSKETLRKTYLKTKNQTKTVYDNDFSE
ncbi:MAG: hypothetical protein HGA61_03975 [Candidatus Moranbacteria bacterium]|nr:hypothetical protein [Candidatus Moranbacteria bacterium]